ncbi:MAG TPA: shikimate dehydrogenase [Trueperaceae bacterium]
MMRVMLFAYPAWHSLSPAMHNAAFASLGLDARYTAREVPPEALPEAVEELRQPDCWGANVTIPHKESIMGLLDALSAEARAVGSVNTIVRRGSELEGHSTDVSGFLKALADLRVDLAGRRVLLLGAGGAGRAVAYALLLSGIGELVLHNRTRERAERLRDDFAGLGEIRVIGDEELCECGPRSQLVINSTSVGMMREGVRTDETPLPAGDLPKEGAVVDLVYRPAETRLLREAKAAGLKTQNGLPMLVYQGAESFSMWTGHTAPVELMRREARRMLAS